MNSILLYIYNVFTFLMPETSCFYLKVVFLRFCGAKVNRTAKICSSVKILGNGKLDISGNVWIGPDVKIYTSGTATVTIEENVDIAPCVKISTGTHEILINDQKIAGKGINKSVKIGSGSWIGMNSVILSGVTVGKRNLIAANSTVHKSTEPNMLYSNNSIKSIRSL
ncbi:acyltransferase [Vibrio vulnificus]|uniref:acyltransferase n=1 Tax=Vibrio vulnificus TaxID=672 RepID=UPI003ED9CC60